MITALNKTPITVLAVLLLVASLWFGKFYVDLFGFRLQPVQFSVLIMLIITIIQKLQTKDISIRKLEAQVSYLYLFMVFSIVLILLAGLLSSFNAINLMNVFKFEIRYLTGILIIFLIIELIKKSEHLSLLINTLVFFGFVTAAISIIGFYSNSILTEWIMWQGGRVAGFFSNANQYAMVLLTIIPIALTRLFKSRNRLLSWFLFLVLAFGLFFTGSKLNLIMLLIVTFLTIMLVQLSNKGTLKKIFIVFMLPLVGFGIYFSAIRIIEFLMPRTYEELMKVFSNASQEVSAVNTRTQQWEEAIRVGKENIFFGIGADNSIYYLWYDHAHNVFFEYFISLGSFGILSLIIFLISILCLIIYSFVLIIKLKNISAIERCNLIAFSVGIVSFVISNQTSESFGTSTLPVLWILLACLISQINIILKKSRSLTMNKT